MDYTLKNNYKLCDKCKMNGLKQEKIELVGLKRRITYKCIYCKRNTIKDI